MKPLWTASGDLIWVFDGNEEARDRIWMRLAHGEELRARRKGRKG